MTEERVTRTNIINAAVRLARAAHVVCQNPASPSVEAMMALQFALAEFDNACLTFGEEAEEAAR